MLDYLKRRFFSIVYIAIFLTITACDPYALSKLTIRPVSSSFSDSTLTELKEIELIDSLITSKGFRKTPSKTQGCISWVNEGLSEIHHPTSIGICLEKDVISIRFFDWESFGVASSTKALANEITDKISATNKNLKFEFIDKPVD